MVAENYTNTFGGQNVHPANLSYVSYVVSESTFDLTWSFEAVADSNPTADKIDINSSYANAMVKMPPADQVTVGQDVLFGNIGVQSYQVTDHSGNVICVIESGIEWFIYLTDNSTISGVWRAVQFGASTSAGTAADLAGAGLRARLTKLDQNLVTVALTGDYTLTDSDRARVIENTGGNVIYTFPDAAAVGNGWFVYVINAGDGNIVLTPVGGQTIDAAVNKTIAPGESLAVLSDGANWHTLGYGRSIVTAVTGAAIPVGGAAGTVVLSATQVAAQIQDFSGVLSGNRRIEYGGAVGYWFVYNNTTPLTPFTMTMATTTLDPGVIVPQGAFSIIRSNGTTMGVAFSGAVGTVTSVATTVNMTGGPITSTGTLDLSNTGVTPATYGDATHTGQFTVDIKGRLTGASAPAIAIPSMAITDLSSILLPGTMIAYGGKLAPVSTQWLPCDGTTRLIADFPALAAALQDAHGPVTGTTFTLPDTRGCVLMGQDPGYRVQAGWFPGGDPNAIGNHGGTQATQYVFGLGQLIVRVGDWTSPFMAGQFTGGTTGAQSVNIVTSAQSHNVTGLAFGGGGYAADDHSHNVNGVTGGEGLGLVNFGAYGRTDAVASIGTNYQTNVQPTLVIRHLIKT